MGLCAHFALNDNSFHSNSGLLPSASSTSFPARRTESPRFAHHQHCRRGLRRQWRLHFISDRDPFGDNCSSKTSTVQLSSRTVGDILSSDGVTWGSFMGGFYLTITNPNGSTSCNRSTVNPQTFAFELANGQSMASATASATVNDYVPHHSSSNIMLPAPTRTHSSSFHLGNRTQRSGQSRI